jgi:hypothetical protein
MSFSNRGYGQVDICPQNWQYDLWIGCLKPIDVASTCETKSNLVVELEVEFENQINNEFSLCLG